MNVKTFSDTPHSFLSVEDAARYILRNVEEIRTSDKHGIIPLVKGKVVVDACCGIGLKSLSFALLGAKQVWCVDSSAPALLRLQETANALGVTNVQPSVTDLRYSVIPECDTLFCSQAIHHIPNWGGVLARMLSSTPTCYLSWIVPWSCFWIKNRILRCFPVSWRVPIGKVLLGWRDRRKNKTNIPWLSFWADIYEAEYYWITESKMKRELRKNGFEVKAVHNKGKALRVIVADRGLAGH